MEFLLGFAGALVCGLLFGGGFLCGWMARERVGKATADPLTPEQKRQLREERDAWAALHNYGVADAYDLRPKDLEGGGAA